MNKKKLFISNLGWKHRDFKKIIKLIKKNNIEGIDIAPIQLRNNWTKIDIKLKKFAKELNKLNIKVNAIQGIFYKKNFNLFESNNFKKKKNLRTY
jgi:sugar phosphate isomerase/epimerase